MKPYDKTILDHYKSVAQEDELSATSTMKDVRTRELETTVISDFYVNAHKMAKAPLAVADIGCGNGYTLSVLKSLNTGARFFGLEYSPELRSLAKERFKNDPSVSVNEIDIRDFKTFGDQKYDVLYCQRVLINILDPEDQRMALNNIINAAKPGAKLLFIEAFQEGLKNLNEARAEFDLDPIAPAHHNLYLPTGFFDHEKLKPLKEIPRHFLSSHYYVARVLHPVLLGKKPFVRNSPAVSFLTRALREPIGEFSPIQAVGFSVN